MGSARCNGEREVQWGPRGAMGGEVHLGRDRAVRQTRFSRHDRLRRPHPPLRLVAVSSSTTPDFALSVHPTPSLLLLPLWRYTACQQNKIKIVIWYAFYSLS